MPRQAPRGGPGSPYYEAVLKFAPILVLAFAIIVGVSLIMDFVQGRVDPASKENRFDAVKHHKELTRGGMSRFLMKKTEGER